MKDGQVSTPGRRDMSMGFLGMRRSIGVIGMTMPILLFLLGIFIFDVRPQFSISHYFFTPIGTVFVAMLSALGVFLLIYRGGDRLEDLLTNLAGTNAIVVALVPVGRGDRLSDVMSGWGLLHVLAGFLMFTTLATIQYFIFPKTEKVTQTKPENVTFRLSGIVIGISLISIFAYGFFYSKELTETGGFQVIFWLETLAVWAFGTGWLAKGKVMGLGQG
jgi:hypothetical protein